MKFNVKYFIILIIYALSVLETRHFQRFLKSKDPLFLKTSFFPGLINLRDGV